MWQCKPCLGYNNNSGTHIHTNKNAQNNMVLAAIFWSIVTHFYFHIVLPVSLWLHQISKVRNSQAIWQTISLAQISAELRKFALKDGINDDLVRVEKGMPFTLKKSVASAEAYMLAAIADVRNIKKKWLHKEVEIGGKRLIRSESNIARIGLIQRYEH